MTTIRQCNNRIHKLLDNEKYCCVDTKDGLCALAKHYFINLFKALKTMRSAGTLTFRHQATRSEKMRLFLEFWT